MSKIIKEGGFYKCDNYYPLLKNPQKYLREDSKLTARSGLEIDYFKKFDRNKNILEWNSENIIVPYEKPMFDKFGNFKGTQTRKYIVDVYIKIRNKKGIVEEILGEIKPKTQVFKPRLGKRKTAKGKKNFINEKIRWFINISKWTAVEKLVSDIRKSRNRNIRFKIFTESDVLDLEEIKKDLNK